MLFIFSLSMIFSTKAMLNNILWFINMTNVNKLMYDHPTSNLSCQCLKYEEWILIIFHFVHAFNTKHLPNIFWSSVLASRVAPAMFENIFD